MAVSEEVSHDLKKYGSPYLLTERGEHQYKTLLNQYLQGIPLKENALLKLFGLGVYAFRVSNDIDTDMGMTVTEEIKKKLGIDVFEYEYNQYVKVYLYEKGLLKDNPDYNEDFSNAILEMLNVE